MNSPTKGRGLPSITNKRDEASPSPTIIKGEPLLHRRSPSFDAIGHHSGDSDADSPGPKLKKKKKKRSLPFYDKSSFPFSEYVSRRYESDSSPDFRRKAAKPYMIRMSVDQIPPRVQENKSSGSPVPSTKNSPTAARVPLSLVDSYAADTEDVAAPMREKDHFKSVLIDGECRLREALRVKPVVKNQPDVYRTSVCFEVLHMLVQSNGPMSVLARLLTDELYRSTYSTTYTIASDESPHLFDSAADGVNLASPRKADPSAAVSSPLSRSKSPTKSPRRPWSPKKPTWLGTDVAIDDPLVEIKGGVAMRRLPHFSISDHHTETLTSLKTEYDRVRGELDEIRRLEAEMRARLDEKYQNVDVPTLLETLREQEIHIKELRDMYLNVQDTAIDDVRLHKEREAKWAQRELELLDRDRQIKQLTGQLYTASDEATRLREQLRDTRIKYANCIELRIHNDVINELRAQIRSIRIQYNTLKEENMQLTNRLSQATKTLEVSVPKKKLQDVTSELVWLKSRHSQLESDFDVIQRKNAANEAFLSEMRECKDFLTPRPDLSAAQRYIPGSTVHSTQDSVYALVNTLERLTNAKQRPKKSNLVLLDDQKNLVFQPLGVGDRVPLFLRSKSKVRYNKISQREAAAEIVEIFHARRDKRVGVPHNYFDVLRYTARKHDFSSWLYDHILNKYEVNLRAIEWGYSFLYTCAEYHTDYLCATFYRVALNIWNEEVYFQSALVEDLLKSRLRQFEQRANGRGLGKVKPVEFWAILRTALPHKVKPQWEELAVALSEDQRPDVSIQYERLFNTTKKLSSFLLTLRRQVLEEKTDYVESTRIALSDICGAKLRAAMAQKTAARMSVATTTSATARSSIKINAGSRNILSLLGDNTVITGSTTIRKLQHNDKEKKNGPLTPKRKAEKEKSEEDLNTALSRKGDANDTGGIVNSGRGGAESNQGGKGDPRRQEDGGTAANVDEDLGNKLDREINDSGDGENKAGDDTKDVSSPARETDKDPSVDHVDGHDEAKQDGTGDDGVAETSKEDGAGETKKGGESTEESIKQDDGAVDPSGEEADDILLQSSSDSDDNLSGFSDGDVEESELGVIVSKNGKLRTKIRLRDGRILRVNPHMSIKKYAHQMKDVVIYPRSIMEPKPRPAESRVAVTPTECLQAIARVDPGLTDEEVREIVAAAFRCLPKDLDQRPPITMDGFLRRIDYLPILRSVGKSNVNLSADRAIVLAVKEMRLLEHAAIAAGEKQARQSRPATAESVAESLGSARSTDGIAPIPLPGGKPSILQNEATDSTPNTKDEVVDVVLRTIPSLVSNKSTSRKSRFREVREKLLRRDPSMASSFREKTKQLAQRVSSKLSVKKTARGTDAADDGGDSEDDTYSEETTTSSSAEETTESSSSSVVESSSSSSEVSEDDSDEETTKRRKKKRGPRRMGKKPGQTFRKGKSRVIPVVAAHRINKRARKKSEHSEHVPSAVVSKKVSVIHVSVSVQTEFDIEVPTPEPDVVEETVNQDDVATGVAEEAIVSPLPIEETSLPDDRDDRRSSLGTVALSESGAPLSLELRKSPEDSEATVTDIKQQKKRQTNNRKAADNLLAMIQGRHREYRQMKGREVATDFDNLDDDVDSGWRGNQLTVEITDPVGSKSWLQDKRRKVTEKSMQQRVSLLQSSVAATAAFWQNSEIATESLNREFKMRSQERDPTPLLSGPPSLRNERDHATMANMMKVASGSMIRLSPGAVNTDHNKRSMLSPKETKAQFENALLASDAARKSPTLKLTPKVRSNVHVSHPNAAPLNLYGSVGGDLSSRSTLDSVPVGGATSPSSSAGADQFLTAAARTLSSSMTGDTGNRTPSVTSPAITAGSHDLASGNVSLGASVGAVGGAGASSPDTTLGRSPTMRQTPHNGGIGGSSARLPHFKQHSPVNRSSGSFSKNTSSPLSSSVDTVDPAIRRRTAVRTAAILAATKSPVPREGAIGAADLFSPGSVSSVGKSSEGEAGPRRQRRKTLAQAVERRFSIVVSEDGEGPMEGTCVGSPADLARALQALSSPMAVGDPDDDDDGL